MPAKTLTAIDLTNRFYCNVDIDSEVAMKLLTLAIKKAMAEQSLHNMKVKFDPYEYKEVVEAVKYVFGVAKEQGLLNDKFLFSAASDSYNDVLLTGKFQTELAHAICEEFSISPKDQHWLLKWITREAEVTFHLPQGPENQRLSIEKMLKVIETTVGMKAEKKTRMTRREILDNDNQMIGKYGDHGSFMEGLDSLSLGVGLPKEFKARFQE